MTEIKSYLKAFIIDNLSGYQLDNIPNFILNLFITAILGYLLGLVYIRFGSTHSNRKNFAHNFVLLAVTTMFIITFVKSSLALSLGLVGALSIVRFRSAIKEPEELSYLFLSIALGLGIGAGFGVLTIIGFSAITIIIIFKRLLVKKISTQNLIISVSNNEGGKIDSNKIVEILSLFTNSLRLKRIDETVKVTEISFLATFNDLNKLQNSISELKKIYPDINITYMDTNNDF